MLRSIKNVHPRRGKTQLFLLYKIGYDVETPSTTFGIDIFHPRASKFADKLNFLLISTTAVTTILNLFRNPKEQRHPITSNFIDTLHYSPGGRTFTFGEISVKTKCCDHNKRLEKFVLAYEIDCGKSAGNAIILYSGDACSNSQAPPDATRRIYTHFAVGLDIKVRK